MWVAIIISTMLSFGHLAEEQETQSPAELVRSAIKNFERPSMLGNRDLLGATIGVEATGGGQAELAKRPGDHLATLTAGYLYHMISRAGGTPVLSRFDDRPFLRYKDGYAQTAEQLFAEYECRLTVSFSYEPGLNAKPADVRPADKQQASAVLARYITAAINGERAQRDKTLPQPDQPLENPAAIGCIVTFQFDPQAKQPDGRLAQKNSLAIGKGLAQFAKDYPRLALDAQNYHRDKRKPFTRTGEAASKLQRIARQIWPEGDLPRSKVAWFCDMFSHISISNPSLALFQPHVEVVDEKVILSGITNTPEISQGLIKALQAVGVKNVDNQMRRLPEEGRLDGKRFGACVASMAVSYSQPSEHAGKQTQLLFGESVFLLDSRDGYYLLHSSDGYWGWVRKDSILPMSDMEFSMYELRPQAVAREDIDLAEVWIPRGTAVRVRINPETNRISLAHPDGRMLPLPRTGLKLIDPVRQRVAANQRVVAGLDLLYVPYLFGGRSPLGLDCSGLTMSACLRNDQSETIARDAWQQAFAGKLTATRWHRTTIQAGDIVFFITSGGRIYHTGVAISPTHIVDSCPPAVQIGSIDPSDPLYDKRMDEDFFMAKRP